MPVYPYVGYGDTTFRGAFGIEGLFFQVNEDLVADDARPSRWARIASVTVNFAPGEAPDSVQRLLRRRLGVPDTSCARREDGATVIYFWPDVDSSGVVLAVPLHSRGRALLTFGAERPHVPDVSPGGCGAG